MRIEIKKMGINGEGIGYTPSNKPVFVEGVFVGEVADVEIIEETNKYARGKVIKRIKVCEDRIKRVCDVEKCNACSLMELKAKKQVELKRQTVAQSLYKYAGIPLNKIERITYNPSLFHYRNQLKMPMQMVEGVLRCGMYLPNSNVFVPVEACKVHEKVLDDRRREIEKILNDHNCQAYDKKTKKGYRTLVLRHLEGKFQCTFVTGKDKISDAVLDDIMKLPGMVNVGQSLNTEKGSEIFGSNIRILRGDKGIEANLLDTRLFISNRSFFQLNTEQTKQLYGCVRKLLSNEKYELIVEAYSGVGGLSLVVRDLANKIIGIESIQEAVDNANYNASLNDAEHVSFMVGDAGEKLKKLTQEYCNIDALVVDPPRTGLSDQFLECVLDSIPNKIVYVSCNLSTLGKDLAVLQKKYNVEKVIPFDMFSHTPLVENVVLLTRKG